ncbi:MAG: helix-turn-helix transcriptional regulator [Chloroflexi bacterium]|nr:MAG: helix-turn-helix transcriptional regulator [Chloroflexota bacterium]
MPEVTTPTPVAPPAEEAPRADPLASAVADAVAKLRRTAGLSERAAARRLGTSQTQLRRMEDPRYLPSLRSLSRVAAAYGYRLSVDFVPQDAPKPKPAPRPQRRPAANKSVSPSKGRRAAQGRGRAAARPRRRGAAQRRRS